MINKRSLWFLTLFSLILVLSVYYITMPSELLMATNNGRKEEVSETVSVKEKENAELVALRVESEEKMMDKISELKKILSDSKASSDEKNKAFEELESINKNRAKEAEIEETIKKEFSLNSFVSSDGTSISVTVDSEKHDKTIANKIMRLVQSNYDSPMSISVKFQK